MNSCPDNPILYLRTEREKFSNFLNIYHKKFFSNVVCCVYLIETPNKAYANRADPDQTALTRAA